MLKNNFGYQKLKRIVFNFVFSVLLKYLKYSFLKQNNDNSLQITKKALTKHQKGVIHKN